MQIAQAKTRLCLALDVDELEEAIKIARLLKEHVGLFKIGSQLFTKEGPKIVDTIKNIGGEVFLDLKYHDIPNTVANSVRMATRLGVYMLNIHASGGREMMRAAVEAVEEESQKRSLCKPIILAVTVLTSLNDNILSEELRIKHDVLSQVIHLARIAQSAGINGCVASPKEILGVREACGQNFIILTPGIRPSWAQRPDDQKRITTPKEAARRGADFIVIGRPILAASDPVEAAKKVLGEIVTGNV
ncbi:Orotidine 5'-phosphate decarboxylase [subsurface metagenome]